MNVEQLLTPGVVLAVGLALWREIKDLRKDLGARIDRTNSRIDTHLDAHSGGEQPVRFVHVHQEQSKGAES